ncbi:UNVERIFIED_CONTAM: methionine aminopeptidase [Streptomyces graminofaciens]
MRGLDDAVVHGMPGDDRLRDGDLVSIDGGAVLDGRVGDAAVTPPWALRVPRTSG